MPAISADPPPEFPPIPPIRSRLPADVSWNVDGTSTTFHETHPECRAFLRPFGKSTTTKDICARDPPEAAPHAWCVAPEHTFTGDTVHQAIPRPLTDDEPGRPSARPGILTHLDAVYGLALALTRDTERAADLTEEVFASAQDDLWATLGGYSLRERLLARCVATFEQVSSARRVGSVEVSRPTNEHASELRAALSGLPWNERAAVTLVDQLGLTYAAGAAVLRTNVAEFRAVLHRGRAVVLEAYRSGAR